MKGGLKEMINIDDVVLDSIPEYVIHLDTERKILRANKTAYESTGMALKDIIGRDCNLVFNSSSEVCAGCPASQVLSSKKLSEGELAGPDGRIWSIKAYPVLDDTNELRGVVEVRKDVTAQKISEESLKETKELFRLLAENARDLIFRYRLLPIKGFDYISPSSEDITGYTPDEFYAQKDLFFSMVLPEYRQEVRDHFESADVDKKIIDLCLTKKDGRIVWLELLLAPEYDVRGKTVSLQGVGRDITEWKQDKDRQKLVVQIFEVLNQVKQKKDKIIHILLLIKEHTGFEAVGIRLKEGDDFPYYETNGFEADFVEGERYICTRDEEGEIVRDSTGEPSLECLCGTVVSGKIDYTLPFYTKNGSFWTNDKPVLDALSKKGMIPHLRGRCFSRGYKTVALIPLRSESEIIGLLQMNDKRKDMIVPEMVGFLEGIAASIGLAFQRNRIEEEREEVIVQLEDALEQVNTLSGLLPICSRCKKIRDDKGSWIKIEDYIKDHSEADLTHGICPDCAEQLYPDQMKK